jgi:hypothetical protein
MSSYTINDTFTITHARHIASRIAADLDLFSRFYGYPDRALIPDYLEEIARHLAKGYMETFEIGFEVAGREVVVGLWYEVRADGTLSDNRAGDLPLYVDTSGATPFNYMTYSTAWWRLTDTERAAFKASMPVQRTSAPEPQHNLGAWSTSRSYASGGVGVQRRNFVAIR